MTVKGEDRSDCPGPNGLACPRPGQLGYHTMDEAKNRARPDFHIRPWLPSDLFPMTDLVARAFAEDRTWGARRNLTEIAITGMIAASPGFDPGLALVAETPEGRPLGLALWLASPMRLRGRRLLAANLAPLAVEPLFAGFGIGSELMRASHEALAAKGVSLAFLCGHEGYYPRFGYRKGMFGTVGIIPAMDAGAWGPSPKLRPPEPGDETALLSLWEECQGEVDLALEPERGFYPWMAWTPSTQALVLEEEGEVRAYARFVNAEPMGAFGGEVETRATRVHLFLAAGARSAAILLGALGGGKDLILPLHPQSRSAARLFPAGFKAVSERGGYAMIRPLPGGPDEDRKAVLEYCDGVESGSLAPGLICLPSTFDLE